MKKFIFSILAIVSVFAIISCERHEWENSAEGTNDGVKNLFHSYKKDGGHDEHATASHGDAEHPEKPDDHAGENNH